jgi:hypothetical protein
MMSRLATRPALVLASVLTASLTAGTALAATPAPTSLTLKAAKSTVAHNTKTTLTGTLKSGTKAVAGQSVKLEKRAYGTKAFSVVSTKTTNAKGTVTYTVVPGTKKGQKTQYELVFAGNSKYKASHSQVITITVS